MIEIQEKGEGILSITPAVRPAGRILLWVGIVLGALLLWQLVTVGIAMTKKKHRPPSRAALLVIFIAATAPGFFLWGRALLASDEILLDTNRNLVIVTPLEGEPTAHPLGMVREVALQKGLQRDPLKAEKLENWAILLITEGEPVSVGAFVVEAVDRNEKGNLLRAAREIADFINKPVRSDYSPEVL